MSYVVNTVVTQSLLGPQPHAWVLSERVTVALNASLQEKPIGIWRKIKVDYLLPQDHVKSIHVWFFSI